MIKYMVAGSGETTELVLFTNTTVDLMTDYETFMRTDSTTTSLENTHTTFIVYTGAVDRLDQQQMSKQTQSLPVAGKNSANKFVAVGTTCSILGLLLGITIAVLFWFIRRRKVTKTRRKSIAMEKNPTEKTFEQIDMSLTFPRQESIFFDTNKRPGSLRINATTSACKHSSELCTPVNCGFKISYPSEREMTEQQYSNQACTSQCDVEHNGLSTKDNNKCGKYNQLCLMDKALLKHINKDRRVFSVENRTPTISGRESLSSGLGTCTGSDVLSYESLTPAFESNGYQTIFINSAQGRSDSSINKEATLQRNVRHSKSEMQIYDGNEFRTRSTTTNDSSASDSQTSKSATLPSNRRSNKIHHSLSQTLSHTNYFHQPSKRDLCGHDQVMKNLTVTAKNEATCMPMTNEDYSDEGVTEDGQCPIKIIRSKSDIVIDL